MKKSSDIPAVFADWVNAELASHYAQPCPDEVMDHLVDATHAQIDRLSLQPASSVDELLLKLFPLLHATFEAKSGEAPFQLTFGDNNGCPELLASVVADLHRLCPAISAAMRQPNYLDQRKVA